jgi:hypothetical protein
MWCKEVQGAAMPCTEMLCDDFLLGCGFYILGSHCLTHFRTSTDAFHEGLHVREMREVDFCEGGPAQDSEQVGIRHREALPVFMSNQSRRSPNNIGATEVSL